MARRGWRSAVSRAFHRARRAVRTDLRGEPITRAEARKLKGGYVVDYRRADGRVVLRKATARPALVVKAERRRRNRAARSSRKANR